jgi:hypothetical protein
MCAKVEWDDKEALIADLAAIVRDTEIFWDDFSDAGSIRKTLEKANRLLWPELDGKAPE